MKIMILANSDMGLYKFRKELVKELLKKHEVLICLPDGPYIETLTKWGCRFIPCDMDRRGTSPLHDLRLIRSYRRVLREHRPDIVFTYTVKPNVYGGLLCGWMHIPYVANITGLTSAFERGGFVRRITLLLHKIGLRHAQRVFFQNKDNLAFLQKNGCVHDNAALIPGSGVNLEEHHFEPYPPEGEKTIFLIIGRVMEHKGINEVLAAAREIKRDYPQAVFRVIGSYEEDYRERFEKAISEGVIEYLGQQDDVHSFIKESHATISASHIEGMSNVLLESAASGRPVIATNIPGCAETFDPGVSGIVCEPRNAEDLARAIRTFLALPYEKKAAMGKAGREKMEREFSREIVIRAYLKEIEKVKGSKNGL